MTNTLDDPTTGETGDAATAAAEVPAEASLYERLGGLYGIAGAVDVLADEFDVVKTEIDATLFHVGVPFQEHGEFMDIIESYRSMVVGPAEA